jgi:hypothetical protein
LNITQAFSCAIETPPISITFASSLPDPNRLPTIFNTITITIKMQFSTVVLALAATASAAVLPRQTGQGQWYAQLTNGPAPAGLYLTATFTSDEYSGDNKLRNACVDSPNNVPLPAPHRCDHKGTDFSYDGTGMFDLDTQHIDNTG